MNFKTFYFRELEVLSNPEYLGNLLIRNGDKLNSLMTKVYHEWPFYELPTYTLYNNQLYIKNALFSDINSLTAHLSKEEDGYIFLYLRNQQEFPLEIFHLTARQDHYFLPEETILLENKPSSKSQLHKFKIRDDLSWSDTLSSELKIHYNVLGLESGKRTALVFPWRFENRFKHIGNPVAKSSNYRSFEFILENEDGELIIPKGNWTFDKDLIIPSSKKFIVESGTRIDLVKKSKIISYSPVAFLGSKDNPIYFHSSDSSGQGIFVLRAEGRSMLLYSTFDYISCPEEKGWQLSGAITFYESPVDISSCTFSNNQRGDDFLNIIRTDFNINQAHFKAINADALDCDFTKGSITNSSFVEVGNDAVDVSGTELEISNIFMNYIGDKGLSAGEDSQLSASWIEIRNAEIGITSKDRSRVEITDATLSNCRIGITLFQKKSEFGPGQISAERVNITQAEIPYLVEEKSKFLLDGEEYLTFQRNVQERLYGVEYGKSSN